MCFVLGVSKKISQQLSHVDSVTSELKGTCSDEKHFGVLAFFDLIFECLDKLGLR